MQFGVAHIDANHPGAIPALPCPSPPLPHTYISSSNRCQAKRMYQSLP